MSLSSDAIAESLEGPNGTFLDREESWGDGIARVAQTRRLAKGSEDRIVSVKAINAPGTCVAGYPIDAQIRLVLGSKLRKACARAATELCGIQGADGSRALAREDLGSRKGEASLRGAAEFAGVPVGQMMTILTDFGVESRLEKDDYLQGLKNLQKVW